MTPARPAPSVRSEVQAIAALAAPISAAHVGLVTMNLALIAIVGRVSVDDLAATSMGRSIFFASSSIAMGVASALDPLASQAVGAGEPGRAWAALKTTLRAGVLSGLFSLAAAFAVTLALAPMGVDPALVPVVQRYLLGHTPGFFLLPVFFAGKSFLQAYGDTRPALLAVIAANAVNLLACALLVHGDVALAWARLPPLGLPRLGALGAGLASSAGAAVLAGLVLAGAAQRRPPAASSPAAPIPTLVVLRLGVPAGAQLLAETGIFTLIGLLAGRLGSHAVAAHQIALSLASFTFMGALGVGSATAVRVGLAIGAGASPRRAGVSGLLLGAAVMGVSASMFAAAPRPFMALFTPDPGVIEAGASLLGIAAVFQLFDGVQAVAAGALRGAGDVRYPFLANVGAHWLLGCPLALALGFGLGLGMRGLWVGLTAGLIAISVVLTARFLRLTRGKVARV